MQPIYKLFISVPLVLSIVSCGPASPLPHETSQTRSNNSNTNKPHVNAYPTRPSGPSNPSDSSQPSNSSTTHLPSWKLAYKSQCTEKSPELCPGAYGFEIKSNGTFKVGPAPNGESYSGELDQEELTTLKQQLNRLDLSTETTAPFQICDSDFTQPAKERVDLFQANSSFSLIELSDSKLCFNKFTSENARRFLNNIHDLLSKYHPERFPNDCTQATRALKNLYSEVSDCIRDDECSYLNENYYPIPFERVDFITSDECSFVKPLQVANYFSAVSNQLNLLTLRDAVREACGKEDYKRSCKRYGGYRERAGTPICHRGRCSLDFHSQR